MSIAREAACLGLHAHRVLRHDGRGHCSASPAIRSVASLNGLRCNLDALGSGSGCFKHSSCECGKYKPFGASPAPRASAVPSAPSAPALRARGVAMAATPEFGAVSLEPFGRIGVSLRRVWVGGVKEDGQGILQIVSPAL
jgi:hypothetical protein